MNSRLFLVVVLLLAVFTIPPNTASAQQQGFAAPDGVDILSPEEILNRVVGNTLKGNNNKYREYYAPDGRIGGWRKNGSLYQGEWAIEGPAMCFRNKRDNYDECFTLAIKDDELSGYDKNGKLQWSAKLLKGNPGNI